MKVTEQTPDHLIIEDRPWLFAIAIWGMSLAGLYAVLTGQIGGWGETLLVGCLSLGGILVAWWFFPFQTITFDRPSGMMTLKISRFTSARFAELPLDQIKRAASQGHFSDGGARLERVALLTKSVPYPLEPGFSSASRTQVIKTINEWLGV